MMSNPNFNNFEINDDNDDGFTTIINNKRSSYKMILEDYRKGKISLDNAEKMLNTKKTYNNYNRDPHFRVTKNGMIALYNIAHKPLVLYANQWEKLGNFLQCNKASQLYKYIEENDGRIKKIPNDNN